MEDTGRGLQRKDDGRNGPKPLPSTPIGVAVQVSLTNAASSMMAELHRNKV